MLGEPPPPPPRGTPLVISIVLMHFKDVLRLEKNKFLMLKKKVLYK